MMIDSYREDRDQVDDVFDMHHHICRTGRCAKP